MARYFVTYGYDGTNFLGSQFQPKGRTVQGELERALKRVHKGETIRFTPSGRTDAGVHAYAALGHFDSELAMDEQAWYRALRTHVPDDMIIRSVKQVADDAHARYDVEKKEYRYTILHGTERDVFRRNYVWWVPQTLDVRKMREAASEFVGTHDWTTFSSAKSNTTNRVRTVYEVRIEERDAELELVFIGEGFLYNMVRIIVATLVDVGIGKICPKSISKRIQSKNRDEARKTAPPQGLMLYEVSYKE
ncbi:MAG: tRNA pseudouridine(38-40) synthase TruA [Bacilli bacterium]